MDGDYEWECIDGLGACQFYRGRLIHIWPTRYVYFTTGELRRKIQGMKKNDQLPSEKIRLFREGKELLDDDEKLPSFSFIDIAYGGLWDPFRSADGLRKSDRSRDKAKVIFTYRYPQYQIFESRLATFRNWPRSMVKTPSQLTEVGLYFTAEDERHNGAHNDWITNVASTITGFGDSLKYLTNNLSNELLRSLAQRVGKPALEMMASRIIGLLKEDSFGLPDILQRATDKILSDQDLVGIADATGGNWQLLGYALGLKQSRIDQIVLDNPTTVMRVFSMLKRWATENTDGPKAGTLLRAMWDCRSITVTWETIFQMFA